jgi:hypothetical protein
MVSGCPIVGSGVIQWRAPEQWCAAEGFGPSRRLAPGPSTEPEGPMPRSCVYQFRHARVEQKYRPERVWPSPNWRFDDGSRRHGKCASSRGASGICRWRRWGAAVRHAIRRGGTNRAAGRWALERQSSAKSTSTRLSTSQSSNNFLTGGENWAGRAAELGWNAATEMRFRATPALPIASGALPSNTSGRNSLWSQHAP